MTTTIRPTRQALRVHLSHLATTHRAPLVTRTTGAGTGTGTSTSTSTGTGTGTSTIKSRSRATAFTPMVREDLAHEDLAHEAPRHRLHTQTHES